MTLRRQGAMGERETRTQGALVAALRARPRTLYRAVQCVLGAKASIFNSLLCGCIVQHLQLDTCIGGRLYLGLELLLQRVHLGAQPVRDHIQRKDG